MDTTLYPTQTYAMVEYLERDGFEITTYAGNHRGYEELQMEFPGWLDKDSPDFERVVEKIKLEPLGVAFREMLEGDERAVWVRGISRYQSQEKEKYTVIRYINGIYQLHPLVDWTEEQMSEFLEQRRLPANYWHYDVTKGEFNLECGIGNVGLKLGYIKAYG